MTRAGVTGGQRFERWAVLISCCRPHPRAGSKLTGAGQGPRDARDLVAVGPLRWGVGMETEFWAEGSERRWQWGCRVLSVWCEGDRGRPHREGHPGLGGPRGWGAKGCLFSLTLPCAPSLPTSRWVRKSCLALGVRMCAPSARAGQPGLSRSSRSIWSSATFGRELRQTDGQRASPSLPISIVPTVFLSTRPSHRPWLRIKSESESSASPPQVWGTDLERGPKGSRSPGPGQGSTP